MEFIKESKRIPKLTQLINLKSQALKAQALLKSQALPTPIKWNINAILITLFILFGIFFLYNCKYGFLKSIDIEPYAFNI